MTNEALHTRALTLLGHEPRDSNEYLGALVLAEAELKAQETSSGPQRPSADSVHVTAVKILAASGRKISDLDRPTLLALYEVCDKALTI